MFQFSPFHSIIIAIQPCQSNVSGASTKCMPLLVKILWWVLIQHLHALGSICLFQVPISSLTKYFLHIYSSDYISPLPGILSFIKPYLHSLRPTVNSSSCLCVPWFFHQEAGTYMAHSSLHPPPYIITSTHASLPSIIQFLGFCSIS